VEWKCGKCGRVYSSEEFHKLKMVPLVPEDTDPYNQHGFTSVCECGYVFHRDAWRLVTDFEVKAKIGLFKRVRLKGRVSTVFLELNYGDKENPLWYETMVFVDEPDNVNCYLCIRYRTREEAEEGHKRVVEAIKSGRFTLVPEEWELIIEEGEIEDEIKRV